MHFLKNNPIAWRFPNDISGNVLKTFDKIVRILQPNKHHEIRNLIEIRDFLAKNSKIISQKSVFRPE